MDEKQKLEESSINSSAQSSCDARINQASNASSETYHPRRDVLLVEEPKKCYLLRELTAERATIEKEMLDVDRLILKLFTSGVLDFISLNKITRNPVRNDRTRALLDHFLQINNNGILRQFISHMRDSVVLNTEALNWAEYMQGCSDSCCMFFIKKYADVFNYILEEYGVKTFAEYFVKSGMLTGSESKDLWKCNYKEGAERFMHILFTKKTILCVADMWFTLVEHQHDIPYLGPYINSFLKAFDEQTGPFCPQFDPQLPIKPLLVKRCYVNLYRLFHLIHVEGTDAVRRIFDAHVSAEELEEEITKNKVLIKNRLDGPDFSSFKKKWINIIYSKDKSKTVHFTLPLFHFLAVFVKKFPRPKKGWTGRLARSDTSPGAYLRRICEMRDHLLKDILYRDLAYEKFDRMWNESSEILGQLGVDEKRLQELRMQPMSIVFIERKYMEKYFNKPLSELLEELIIKKHRGIDSICACSLAKDLRPGQKLEAKVDNSKEELKGKDTSEDEFAIPAAAIGDSRSKKRRKKSRGKKGKKPEAGPQTLPHDADVLQELNSAPTQKSEIPKDLSQEILEKSEATVIADSFDSKDRSEDESDNETSQTRETFSRIEAERTELIQYIEDLHDSCKQIENESFLEIKAWKQKIKEKEKENMGLQQEIVGIRHQLQEESDRMVQEQKNHQTQLLKVKELIRVKSHQRERYIKSINDKNEKLLKLKRELQHEQEQWCHKKLQLEEEMKNAKQTETENIKKAMSQECLFLEMRRDFLLSNLEAALLEAEHQLHFHMAKTKRMIVDLSHIQAVNKWKASATDLRSKIDYTKENFNNHIQLIKNGAKLSSLPELINPEPPYPLSLLLLKSGRKPSSQGLPQLQHSFQLLSTTTTAATILTPPSGQLHRKSNRSELSNCDPGRTEQDLWLGVEFQKASKQLVQQQEENTEEDPCVICHEELVPPEGCYELECKHIFHKKCINYWLKEQSTCPICRILVLKPEDYPQLPKK
ncbi:E3 ubiquitin-protein ligase DZIP3-like isoform X2 [Narcine bancroftii]|uniref:E3 ubiquitin-protein ligase DZIP3-like isoform X2 n=1 Tax=Narcine bancroftii TaxID=1343680 RepID=UPI00383198FC